jgi:hypothetical protein
LHVRAKVLRSTFGVALRLALIADAASCVVAHGSDHPSVDLDLEFSDASAAEGHSAAAAAAAATSSPMATTRNDMKSAIEATSTTPPHHDENRSSGQTMTGLHAHPHGPPSSYHLHKLLREGGYFAFVRHAKSDIYGKYTFPDADTIASQQCSVKRNLSPPDGQLHLNPDPRGES